jgi:hypothetical protein
MVTRSGFLLCGSFPPARFDRVGAIETQPADVRRELSCLGERNTGDRT